MTRKSKIRIEEKYEKYEAASGLLELNIVRASPVLNTNDTIMQSSNKMDKHHALCNIIDNDDGGDGDGDGSGRAERPKTKRNHIHGKCMEICFATVYRR